MLAELRNDEDVREAAATLRLLTCGSGGNRDISMAGVTWLVNAHAPPNRGGHLLARFSDSSVCASYVYVAVPPHLFPRRASADVERVDGSRSSGAPQPRGGQPLGLWHARTPAQAAERIRAAGAARPGPAAGSRWGLGARTLRHARISRKLQQGIGPAVGFS